MISVWMIGLAPAHASEPNRRQVAAVERCLAHWESHPFGAAPDFRVLERSIRVVGLGTRQVVETPTEWPELVLVEPSVNLMTKTTYGLHNPNGWYCFDTNIGVMSKIVYDLDCDAAVADARSGARVLGGSQTNGGVVVMGGIEVRRTCGEPTDPRTVTAQRPDALPVATDEPMAIGDLPPAR